MSSKNRCVTFLTPSSTFVLVAIPTAFGELLKECRERKGYSQPQLAKMAGVSVGYIGGIESGARGKRPSRDFVIRLARALSEPPYELLKAANRLREGDSPDEKPRRPTFEQFVRGEPGLQDVEQEMLIRLFRSYVGGAPNPSQPTPTATRRRHVR